MLYLLATGRLPFDGPNPHSLLRKILDGDYPDPLRSAPRVGHRFAAIVRRAMSRIPDDRFPDAASLRQALLGFCAEVGWDDPPKELDRYFGDPDGVTARVQAALIAKLPALGLAARSRGDLPDAMGYFNRALAIDPGNLKVLSLVRAAARAHRRRRVVRSATIVGVAALASTLIGIALTLLVPVKPTLYLAPPPAEPVRRPMVMPPARVTETERPAVVVDVPAAVIGPGPAARVAVRTPERRDPGASAAAAPLRPVRIAPLPVDVMYSVNGDRPRPFSSQEMPLHLPVGHRATIRVFRDGFQDFTWDDVVEAGDTDLSIRPRLRRSTPESDAGPRAALP